MENKKDSLSIEQMVGQMIVTGFKGLDFHENHPIAHSLKEDFLSGVILFDEDFHTKTPCNISSREQVKKLTDALKSFSDLPVLIAVDQEGGDIVRLKKKHGFTETVSAQYLGEVDDLDQTEQQAQDIARDLTDAGVNLNLAPVVDLNINPDNPVIGKRRKSFSSNPDLVIKHAGAFIKAHREKNILTCLKHFPGHGSSLNDSHVGFVDITQTWQEKELYPYRFFIQHHQADLIMTAHLFHQKMDEKYPASLSFKITTELLREKLGYEGVVISDDLQMRAILDHYSLEETVLLFIQAGGDLLLFGNNLVYDENIVTRVKTIILKALKQKEITEKRIEQSWQRIQKLKEKI